MKYLYILDYTARTCDIFSIDTEDAEEWLIENNYDLDNIEWMIASEFHLNVVI